MHVRADDGLAGPIRGPARARTAACSSDLGGAYHEVVGCDVAAGAARRSRRPSTRRSSCSARAVGRGGPSCTAARSSTGSSALSGSIDVHVISHRGRPTDERAVCVAALAHASRCCRPGASGSHGRWRSRGPPVLTLLLSSVRDHIGSAVGAAPLPARRRRRGGSRRHGTRRWSPRSPSSLYANWFFFAADPHAGRSTTGENVLALVVFVDRRRIVVSWFVATRRGDPPTRHAPEPRPRRSCGSWPAAARRIRSPHRHRAPRDAFGLARSPSSSTGPDAAGRVEAAAGAEPPADPSDGTTTVVDLGDGVVLALRGRRHRRRGPAGAPRVRRASSRPRSGVGGSPPRPRPRRAHEGQRAADRVARGRVARPAHPARVDQGVGVELLPTDVAVDARGRAPSSSRRSTRRPTGSTALVANLLDMSRLQAGALHRRIARRWASRRSCRPRSRASATARGTASCVDVPETLRGSTPMPRCWSGRWRTSSRTRCGGRRHEPCRSASRPARRVHDRVDLRVIDHGPGIPVGRPRAGVPAVPAARRPRGDRRRARARGRARVRRGDGRRAAVEDTPEGGTTMVVIRCRVGSA